MYQYKGDLSEQKEKYMELADAMTKELLQFSPHEIFAAIARIKGNIREYWNNKIETAAKELDEMRKNAEPIIEL
jgi:hypothetical protein